MASEKAERMVAGLGAPGRAVHAGIIFLPLTCLPLEHFKKNKTSLTATHPSKFSLVSLLSHETLSFLGQLYSFNCVLAYLCSLDLLQLNWCFLLDSSLQNRTCYHVWRCFSAYCSQIQWLWNQTQSKQWSWLEIKAGKANSDEITVWGNQK